MGDTATDQGFRRGQNAGHGLDLRHGECTVHGMDGTEKCIFKIGTAGNRGTLQPFIECLQMT